MLVGGIYKILEKRKDGHGPHTARHWRDGGDEWSDLIEIHITDKSASAYFFLELVAFD